VVSVDAFTRLADNLVQIAGQQRDDAVRREGDAIRREDALIKSNQKWENSMQNANHCSWRYRRERGQEKGTATCSRRNFGWKCKRRKDREQKGKRKLKDRELWIERGY